jgi:FkbM family methyltransferase
MINDLIKKFFKGFGLDVRRIPPYQIYDWLKEEQIRTIIDIGANEGQFARRINKLLPDAKIYSFEPLKQCRQKMKLMLGNIAKISIFPYAIGDKNGMVQMYKSTFTPSSSLLPMEKLHEDLFPYAKYNTIETVEIKKLDDAVQDLYMDKNILIKIDVQGYEDRVLKGGDGIIDKTRLVIIETSFKSLYKGQLLFNDIYSILHRKGFKFFGAEDRIRDPINGSTLQFDSVFIKE